MGSVEKKLSLISLELATKPVGSNQQGVLLVHLITKIQLF